MWNKSPERTFYSLFNPGRNNRQLCMHGYDGVLYKSGIIGQKLVYKTSPPTRIKITFQCLINLKDIFIALKGCLFLKRMYYCPRSTSVIADSRLVPSGPKL